MRFNLSLLIFLFIAFNAGGQLSNGLIAHWDFNGNANDVSGNNINGTVTGATLVAGYNGIANTAYQFNGNGDQINIPYNSLMNITDSFSICALVKPTAFYSGPCQGNYILTRGTSLGPDFYNMGIFDQAYDLDCNIYSPNNEVFFSGDIGGAGVWYSGNTIINLNTWYCAVVTYDGDSARLYIDGIKRITLPWNKVYSPSTNGIAIAYYPAGGSQFPYWFTGSIDDIRLYRRALSATEAMQYCDSAKSLVIIIDTTVAIDSVSRNVLCTGSNFNVYYSVNHSFQSGNTFTVQLSDVAGSFSSPISIGSVAATTLGIIPCTIPPGTSPGTGYRIRIVASLPAYISADTGITITTGSLTAPTAGNNGPICAGNTLKLNSNSSVPAVNYSWNGPGNFSSPLQNPIITNTTTNQAGIYTITISYNGCINSANTNVIIYPNQIPSFTVNGNLCVGDSLNVVANTTSFNPSYYIWNFGTANVLSGTGPGPYIISNSTPGNEIISLAYAGNCQSADTQTIVIHPIPTDHIIASKTNVCSGDTIQLHPLNDSSAYTYKWSSSACYFSDSNLAVTTASAEHSGSIYLHISDPYSCIGKDSINIIAEPCCQMFVPNAFSPNGDSKNDIFRVRSVRPFESFLLIVFNRWGQEVFRTKNQEDGWNGTFNGIKQEIGTYFYYIKYNCGTKELSKKGDLTLIR